MQFIQRLKNPNVRTALIVVGFLGLAILLILANDTIRRGSDNASEFTPTDSPAVLVNGEELYTQIDDGYQFDNLRKDLATYGRSTIDKYKSGNVTEVVFEITNDSTKDGDDISFEGKYEESGDLIGVELTKLPNSRLKLSITNRATGTNINNSLSSNTKRNQFAATLPIDKDDYSIEFYVPSESFVIKLYDPETEGNARQIIITGLGTSDLSGEAISVVPLGDFSDRNPVTPNNQSEGDYRVNPDDY